MMHYLVAKDPNYDPNQPIELLWVCDENFKEEMLDINYFNTTLISEGCISCEKCLTVLNKMIENLKPKETP